MPTRHFLRHCNVSSVLSAFKFSRFCHFTISNTPELPCSQQLMIRNVCVFVFRCACICISVCLYLYLDTVVTWLLGSDMYSDSESYQTCCTGTMIWLVWPATIYVSTFIFVFSYQINICQELIFIITDCHICWLCILAGGMAWAALGAELQKKISGSCFPVMHPRISLHCTIQCKVYSV